MRLKSGSKTAHRGSALILFTLMLPTLLIPLAGLGIDATMCYIVQAKLGSAVDGAALGAGRLLGVPGIAPATFATALLTANFRDDGTAGFWGATYNKTPTITYTPGITKTIYVDAQVKVPLMFARVFGQRYAVVSATATAQRTDTRVVLVIDRSGSMNTSDFAGSTVIEDAKAYAASFTQTFTESADELGLVVYDGSAVVAYPALSPNWDPTTTNTSTGGPDAVFNDPTNTHNMVKQIQAIASNNGQTGTADALWLAYIELQKAHLKDLKKDGTDYRLNSIVLLTDGLPQSVSVWPNNPADKINPVSGLVESPPAVLKTTSTCANKVTVANPNPTPILGWIAVSRNGSNTFTGQPPLGLYQLASRDNDATRASHDSVWWVGQGRGDEEDPLPDRATGCGALDNQPGPNLASTTLTDFKRIPAFDMWGNSMAGTAYKTVSDFVDKDGKSITNPLAETITFDPTKVTDGDHWALSFWNAADDSAKRIRADVNLAKRTGDIQNLNIQIYVIGYAGNGGVDQGLLKRIANDPGAAGFDSTQATGLYIPAGNATALAEAFNTVATAILRLSR